VFVNHLSNGITQQNYILVKGLDLTLKFDPVYQIYRYWYVLFTQSVQERILQSLPFIAHWQAPSVVVEERIWWKYISYLYSTGFSRGALAIETHAY
jgi:hypothetical protein